ncbi:MAG: glutathione S-transferase family protein [Actinomycetota bacterium]
MVDHPIVLAGQYGSPYSLKMRAVLRYRHIPFRWVLRDSKWDDLPDPPVRLIPMIVYPNPDGSHGEVTIDSSPQIMRLEDEYSGRRVVPTDAALRFIDSLIEDFADEWLTKAMYHYRWTYDADIDKAGKLLPLSSNLQLTSDAAQQSYDFITQRQIGRRELVGSTDITQPIIEDSYRRVLDALAGVFATQDFVLGDRPGRGDFGLFGQLSQLVRWDPTSTTIAATRAPRVINWVDRVDDLSWLPVDGDRGWTQIETLGDPTRQLLTEIGRTYVPFMIANAEAIEHGRDDVVVDIAHETYRQAPFAYQAKCLRWLRAEYAALTSEDKSRVDDALAGTGCEALTT